MTSGSKIMVEADLGRKGVEKTDIFVYQDGRLIETFFDMTFNDIRPIADKIKDQYAEAEVQVSCVGENCCGGLHRWEIGD